MAKEYAKHVPSVQRSDRRRGKELHAHPSYRRNRMRIDLYLHADKESAYEAGKEAGLSKKACDLFMYAGYEETMTYEVNSAGSATLVAVNGRALAPKEKK